MHHELEAETDINARDCRHSTCTLINASYRLARSTGQGKRV